MPLSLDLLVILHQSQSLEHLQATSVPKWITGVRSQDISVLLLLRDPLNWGASFMKRSGVGKVDATVWPEQWLEYGTLWKTCAPLVPDGTIFEGAPTLRVSYNDFVTSKSSRQLLAERLGLEFTDVGRSIVTNHGGGSSFDSTSFDGSAEQMRVLERWAEFKEDRDYISALNKHPLLTQLAVELFDLPAECSVWLQKRGSSDVWLPE